MLRKFNKLAGFRFSFNYYGKSTPYSKNKAIVGLNQYFELNFESNIGLLRFSLCDWFRKLAPLSQPINQMQN